MELSSSDTDIPLSHDNCIVTQHSEDSSDSSLDSDDNTSSDGGQTGKGQDDYMNITSKSIEDTDLTTEECFTFMLEILKKVENRLKISQDSQRDWFALHIELLKTTLIKSAKLWEIEEVISKNGNLYIKTFKEKQNGVSKETKLVRSKKNETNDKCSGQSFNIHDNDKSLETKRRVSERRKTVDESKKAGTLNRMSFMALTLPSASSTPHKTGIENMEKKKQDGKTRNVSQTNIQRNNEKNISSPSSETASKQNIDKNKRPNVKKKLRITNLTIANPFVKGTSGLRFPQKRRALSCGGPLKKQKSDLSLGNSSSSSSSSKRKLYSEQTWLTDLQKRFETN